MGKRQRPVSEAVYDSDGAEVFLVEVIKKARIAGKRKHEFLVKWAGYPSDDDSWEPHANVQNCQRLLKSFWREVGEDKRNYHGPMGREFVPSQEWIKDETQLFRKEFAELEEEKQRKREKKKRKKQSQHETAEASSSKLAPPPLTGKRRRILDSDEDPTASSDDVPLFLHDLHDLHDEPMLLLASESSKPRGEIARRKDSLSMTPLSDPVQDPKGKGKAIVPPGPEVPDRISLSSNPSGLLNLGETEDTSMNRRSKSLDSLFGSSPARSVASNIAATTTNAHPEKPSMLVKKPTNPLPPRRDSHHKTPKVKLLPLKIHQGSTLLTKRKIFQNEIATATPTTAPTQPPVRSKFEGMKIKKYKPSESPVVTSAPADIVKGATTSDNAPPPRSGFSSGMPDGFGFDSMPDLSLRQTSFMHPSRAPLISSANPAVTEDDVDNLLATISSAIYTHNSENLSPQEPPQASDPHSDLQFEKGWKWRGDLFIDVGEDDPEHICDVAISDASEHVADGFRFGVILNNEKSLRINKTYTMFDAQELLRALRRVDQFAQLSPGDDKDKEAFHDLFAYLDKGQLVTRSPVKTNYGHVAEFLIFASTNAALCSRLDVPPNLRDNDALVIALMPWHITPTQYRSSRWRPDHSSAVLRLKNEAPRVSSHLHRKPPAYQLAIHVLGFPESLVKFMVKKKYCVWSYPVEPMPKDRGRTFGPNLHRDTAALFTILNGIEAENLGHKQDIRVVFVHVGALHTLGGLPGLVDRRMKCPQIQFWTYGCHEAVEPSRWGLREIFPAGGIVTFTHTALLENPWGVECMIEKLNLHPLWDCYILPSVLGFFAKLMSSGDDPLTAYDKNSLLLGNILNLIDQGRISLLRCPPINKHSEGKNDVTTWIDWQISLVGLSPCEVLEICLGEFSLHHANKREMEAKVDIDDEIGKSLQAMQLQPAISSEYRRFVVIKGVEDTHIDYDFASLEWWSLKDFDFRDDYFPKPLFSW